MEREASVLSHQNQTLAFQLEEKQRLCTSLQDKVKEYEEKETGYKETLLCVNRMWGKLQEDIRFMCNDALLSSSCPTSDHNASAPSDDQELPFSPSTSDPFLSQLLHSCSGASSNGRSALPSLKAINDEQKQNHCDLSDVEEALTRRAAATQRSLSSVFSRIDALWKSRATHSGNAMEIDNGAPSTSGPQETSPEALIASLRQQVAHSHSAYRTTSDRVKIAEGRAMDLEEQITRLRNELADTEQQLSSMQRKHAALTSSQALGALIKTESGDGLMGGGTIAHSGSMLTLAPNLTGTGGTNHAGAGPSSLPPVVPGVPSHEHEEVLEELKVLRELLESRSSELEKEREGHFKTRRELDESKVKMADESGVPSSRAYTRLQRELQQSMETLRQRSKELDSVLIERDHAVREVQAKGHVSAELLTVKREVQSLRGELDAMRAEKLKSDKVKQELEMRLHRETLRANESSSQSYVELVKVVSSMQMQLRSYRDQLQLGQVTDDRLEASAREVAESSGRIEVRRLQAQRLHEKLQVKVEDLKQGEMREQELKEKIRDLEAFIEVLTLDREDLRGMDEIRASEQSLGSKVKELESKLDGHELQAKIRQMEARVSEESSRTDLAMLDADALRAEVAVRQRRHEETEKALSESQSRCQLFRNEMQAMEGACEDLQGQNERLIEELARKEALNSKMVTEEFAIVARQQAVESQYVQLSREVAMLKKDYIEALNLRELMERQAGDVSRELAKAKDLSRQHALRADSATAEVSKRDDALALAAEAAESLKKQLADSAANLEEAQAQLNKDRTRKKKLDDELKVASSKLDQLRKAAGGGALGGKGGGSTDKELQAEVEAMRQIIHCNVCHERYKDTVISKCGHVFCHTCVQKRIDGRDRKCPRCGILFSKDEVKQIHL